MRNDSHYRIHPETRQRARQLRQTMTPAEQALWRSLRSRNLGDFKFRRQHPIGSFIVDFYCPEVKLAIEIDGDVHAGQEEYDAARSVWLQERGFTVIRFQNRDVLERLNDVAVEILTVCDGLKDRGG